MSSSLRSIAGVSPLCVALLLGACGKADRAEGAASPDGAPAAGAAPVSDLPAAARTALDAGNAAYRAKDMDGALASYRAAAAAAPGRAAPWFGVYMVAADMKNMALADSAMANVKAYSPQSDALEEHARTAAASGSDAALPPGHPSAQALPPGHPSALPPAHPAVPATAPGKRADQ